MKSAPPHVANEEDEEVGKSPVESMDHTISRAQRYFASFVPKDVSLVDELLSDRRDEVRREHHLDANPKVPPRPS